MYQKEMIYLHLFHNDIKGRNVGFLKVEKREKEFKLQLQIKNLEVLPKARRENKPLQKAPIRLQTEKGWKEIGTILLAENEKWEKKLEEEVYQLEILLSDTDKIVGQSKEMPEIIEENPQVITETIQEEKNEEIEKEVNFQEEMNVEKQKELKKVEISESEKQASVKRDNQPHEDKWEQLLSTYEKIHPYGDSRTYIKLEPKDFIILRSNYQHLVNNSFLLHGFYNYRYLILGKEQDFYLGVPGVFYEREKMVALMFGFEAFDCEGGVIEEGKFGYYLRKVEI